MLECLSSGLTVPSRGVQGTLPTPTLSYWCFGAGVAMRILAAAKVRCVLLTSGTLSPLDGFAAELQLPFPITLESPHVIDPSQVWLSIPATKQDNSRHGPLHGISSWHDDKLIGPARL